MARQADTCWKCGATWDSGLVTRNPLRVIPDRAAERPKSGHQPLIPATVSSQSRVAHAQHDVDRWTDEGGRVAAEASARTAHAHHRAEPMRGTHLARRSGSAQYSASAVGA
jgi:hypothetical protein